MKQFLSFKSETVSKKIPHDKSTEDRFPNLISVFPSEIIENVFIFLDSISIVCMLLTNQQYYKLVEESETIWRHFFQRSGNHSKLHSKGYKETYVQIVLEESKLKKQHEKEASKNANFRRISCHPDRFQVHDKLAFKSKHLVDITQSKFSIEFEKTMTVYLKIFELFKQVNIDEIYFKKACFRYEKFLELTSKYPDSFLVPTVDIDIIWHCHLLRPSKYLKDCEKKFGKLINHKIKLSDYETSVKEEAILETKKLWEKEFKIPYFEDEFEHSEKLDGAFSGSMFHPIVKDLRDLTPNFNAQKIHSFNLNPDYSFPFSISITDVLNDLKFQSDGGNIFGYVAFWDFLSENSKKVKEYNPPPDIDIVWHLHMLHPFAYLRDSIQEFGFLLDHIQEDGKKEWSYDEETKNIYENKSVYDFDFD
eukprot:gene7345-11663_t